MIPDLRFPRGVWTDVYALSSIAVGTALVVTNKLQTMQVLSWEGAAPPSSTPPNDGLDGYPVLYGVPQMVTAGAAGCWLYAFPGQGNGAARICVQEAA